MHFMVRAELLLTPSDMAEPRRRRRGSGMLLWPDHWTAAPADVDGFLDLSQDLPD